MRVAAARAAAAAGSASPEVAGGLSESSGAASAADGSAEASPVASIDSILKVQAEKAKDRARAHAQLLAALQAAQLAANDIAAIPSRIKPPPLDAAAAPDVSLQSDVDWSKFTVTSERIAYRRFLQVNSRAIRYPDGKTHEFDVCVRRQPAAAAGDAADPAVACGLFVCVLPYFSADGTVALIREFAQGPVAPLISCCVGGFDPSKHADIAAAAAAEMREEARLTGGRLIPLLRDNHPGALELKWSSTRFHSFLCVDPEGDDSPPNRDAEEFIEVLPRMSLSQALAIAHSGDMHLPSAFTIMSAARKLGVC